MNRIADPVSAFFDKALREIECAETTGRNLSREYFRNGLAEALAESEGNRAERPGLRVVQSSAEPPQAVLDETDPH